MDRYTTYCTEEQTKKALALGAPIKYIDEDKITFSQKGHSLYIPEKWGYFIIPTVEQMFYWLEEQGFYFYIFKDYLWNGEVQYGNRWHYSIDDVCSRKEATLATIDKALNYLIKIKEETK